MNIPSFQATLAGTLGLALWAGCAGPRPDFPEASDSRASRQGWFSLRRAAAASAEQESKIAAAAHYATALSHDLNEEPELALEHYLKAALGDPAHEPVVTEAARRLLRAGRSEEALSLLRTATRLPDAPGALYAWLGLAHAQLGQTSEAIAANRTAIRKMPGSLAPYQNLAQLYLQSNRTDEALEVLAQASEQDGVEAAFLLELAELYTRYIHLQHADQQTVEPAIRKLLTRVRAQQPLNPILTERLADAYAQLGEYAIAAEICLELVEMFPALPGLRRKVVELYLRAGQADLATEHLQTMARIDPTNPHTYFLLGAVALEAQRYEDALEHLSRVILLHPEFEPVYYELAGLRINLRQPDQALELLGKARDKFKPNFILEFYSGLAQSQKQNYAEAIKHYTSAEILAGAVEPERLSHLFFFQTGAAYEREGHYEQAENYLKKTLELAPDFADALNYLGYMWADLNIHLEEARQLILRAVDLEPENAAYLDSLGWVLHRLGQPKEALEWLLKAVEHSEEPDATIYDHLGDVYATLDQPEKARAAWEKALSLEPSDEIRRKLEPARLPAD